MTPATPHVASVSAPARPTAPPGASRASPDSPRPVNRTSSRHPPSSHPRLRRTASARVSPPALSFLPKALLRLVPGVLRAGAPSRPDGVLLLLSALAMAVLAVSSFALLRRLKRFEERT